MHPQFHDPAQLNFQFLYLKAGNAVIIHVSMIHSENGTSEKISIWVVQLPFQIRSY